MGKKILVLFSCLLVSILIVVFSPTLFPTLTSNTIVDSLSQGKFHQTIQEVSLQPKTVYRLYEDGNYIGTLNDQAKLNKHLKEVYQEQFAEKYPNSACHLGRNVYLIAENSYFTYSDVDQDILLYLDQKGAYTLEATAITFSDETGEYAEIYVNNENTYEEAMNEYLSLFIDPTAYAALQNGSTIADLNTYGSKDIGLSIAEDITMSKKNASPSEIKTTKDEVLSYLEYGDNTEKEYYEVQEYDTVAGVGAKNYGLSATQLININRDQLSSKDQVLSAGMRLCITYFQSPITITVNKQSLKKEEIYFTTVTQEDNTLLEDTTEIVQTGENGSRNALYTEKWVNGVLTGATLKSSVETKQPVDEVVSVGTKKPSYIGTGSFRYPVDNAEITCAWGCYYGHRGTDIADAYDRWGDVYAADNGTVKEVGYNSVNGNYIKIDHNNGFVTYYGHMRLPTTLQVGDIVQKGDVIGHIGMTGMATGPHVHFFIEENGERRNACEVAQFPSCEAIS